MHRSPRDEIERAVEQSLWALLLVVLVAILVLLAGCQTARAVQSLPGAWWQGTFGVLDAFVRDIVALLKFLV